MGLDFYIDAAEAGLPQALEFTMQQTFCTSNCGGQNDTFTRFTDSMQCDFKDSGKWRVWNTPGFNWMDTAVPCSPFPSGGLNDLTFYFSRPDLAHSRVDAFALNGALFPLSVTVGTITVAPSEEYLASVQLDGDFAQHSYSVLIDNWSIDGQTAPEPASVWLCAIGAMWLARVAGASGAAH